MAHHALLKLISHDGFEIRSAEISILDNIRFVTIRFSHPAISLLWDDSLPILKIDLENGCLSEYVIGERNDKIKVETAYDFKYPANEFPKLSMIRKRSKFMNSAISNDIHKRETVTTISYFPQGRFPESAFTLSAFGLLEPVTETPPPNRNFLWITLGSVAAVIIAVLVRRKIKSLEAKAS